MLKKRLLLAKEKRGRGFIEYINKVIIAFHITLLLDFENYFIEMWQKKNYLMTITTHSATESHHLSQWIYQRITIVFSLTLSTHKILIIIEESKILKLNYVL